MGLVWVIVLIVETHRAQAQGTGLPIPNANANAGVMMSARQVLSGANVNGDWVPIEVTISDPAPRRAVIEVVVSNGGSVSSLIESPIVTYATPTTHRIHVPNNYHWRGEVKRVVLREVGSGARIASAEVDELSLRGWQVREPGGVVGVVGSESRMQGMLSRLNTNQSGWQHLGERIPLDLVSLDALDVLVLWSVDLSRMGADEERTLIRYLNAGGYVLIWPGEHMIDEARPLVRLLPARVGAPARWSAENLGQNYVLVDNQTDTLIRPLEARPGSQMGSEFHGAPGVVWQDVGLGRLAVISLDPGALTHMDPNKRAEIGSWVLSAFMDHRWGDSFSSDRQAISKKVRPGVYSDGTTEPQEALLARLANFPDVRVIDPRWVLWGMIALGLLVGPVDWMVLRAIGKQPLTWMTVVGWSLLVTGGALLAVSGSTGGASHLRTMTIVDQLDSTAVHRSVHVCMYAARRERVEIESATGWWWRVPNTATSWMDMNQRNPRTGMRVEFDQTATDTTPRAFGLARRSALVMRADAFEPSGALIEAKLELANDQVVGTITSRSDVAFDRFEIEIPGVGLHELTGNMPDSGIMPVSVRLDAFGAKTASVDAFDATSEAQMPSPTPARAVFGLHGLTERSHREDRIAGMVVRAFGRTNDPPARVSFRGEVEAQHDVVVRVRLSGQNAVEVAN